MDYDIVIDLRNQAENHPLDVNLNILNDAADEIESLRTKLAEREWISVDDGIKAYTKDSQVREAFKKWLGTCNSVTEQTPWKAWQARSQLKG